MKTDSKILIVEDEVSLSNALRDKFSLKNFIVFQAKDGEDGLKIALQERPDLILLDLIMPKMDGIAMLKKLRSEEWGQKVRVIVLTNLIETGKVAADLSKEQVYEYVVKSDCKIEDVVSMVCKRLGC